MYFILPETKGISLERMDAIFGEVDAVEAGEQYSLGKVVPAAEHRENIGGKNLTEMAGPMERSV